MSSERIVIAGGGPAAMATAESYREHGGEGAVTILAGERHLPYQRPPLTKEYLRGEGARGELSLQEEGWYRENGIDVQTETMVAELDTKAGTAVAEDGRSWPFDRCVLATGSRPATPGLPGLDRPEVQVMRTIEDSERLAAAAERGGAIVVVGSGFIGCEAAASLAMRGARVTIAAAEERPQAERLDPDSGQRLSGWLSGLGVTVVSGSPLVEISQEGGRTAVRLETGRHLAADHILLAMGVSPNSELAAEAGLRMTDDVVLTDSRMRSSNDEVLVVGDLAMAHNDAAGRRLRVEHWGEALNHGKVAGSTLAGGDATWAVAPGFWSTIGRKTLKYVAWGDGHDAVRFEAHAEGAFTAWYEKEGRLVGALTHERDDDYDEGRRILEEGK